MKSSYTLPDYRAASQLAALAKAPVNLKISLFCGGSRKKIKNLEHVIGFVNEFKGLGTTCVGAKEG